MSGKTYRQACAAVACENEDGVCIVGFDRTSRVSMGVVKGDDSKPNWDVEKMAKEKP